MKDLSSLDIIIDIDHNVRSHQFFQSQSFWSDGIQPSSSKDYNKKISEYNKNVEMDRMMRLSLDCLSAISCFMNPNIGYLGANYDELKAKVFWESIKSVSQTNIDIINNKEDDAYDTDSTTNELIKLSFPMKDYNNNEEKSNWHHLQWATIHYDKFRREEYQQLLKDNMSLIRNDCKPNKKIVTIAHLIATGRIKDIPMELISNLFNKFPTLASTEDPLGQLPLHYAAKYCKDGTFLQYIIQQNPKALVTFTKYDINILDFLEDLPIDFSIKCDNLDMFKILLSASKGSVFVTDPKEGSNLVHRCAGCDAYKEEYLKLLIQSYPKAVQIPDNYGRYPLHLASRNSNSKKVSLILNSFREAVQIRDSDDGWLPLDYTAASSTVEIFNLLYDAYPEGITEEMGKDSTLHIAVDNNYKNVQTIKHICETFPHLTKIKGEDGDLPLHDAVSWCFYHSHPFEMVKAVYDIHPDAVKVKGEYDDRLPIHFLNIVEEDNSPYKESMKILKLICSDNSESLDIENPIDDNITPYNKYRVLSNDLHRCLSRIGRLNHDQEFRDLNFEARRMAMFLAFRGVSDDLDDLNIWRKLKVQNNMELLRYTIAFL